MKKKGIKKYYPGVNGLTNTAPQPGQGKGYGVLAPQPEDPNKFSIGKMLFPEQKTLGKIVDNKVPAAGSTPPAAKGPSFGDKAGAFMGNYGGAITSAASSLMPLLMKKPDPNAKPYKKGSKLIKYQAGANNIDVIGQGPMDNLKEFTPEQLASFNAYENKRDNDIAIDRVNRMGAPVSPIAPKMASLNIPSYQSPASMKLKPVPLPDKPSRRERKAEDKRLETLARAPITYSENTFAGPSDEELKTGKAKQDAEAKQDKQLKDSFQSDVLGKTTPTLKNRSTEKNPILYKESFKRTMFKDMTPAQQKQYRTGMASGGEFTVEGIGKYGAASKEEMAFSARMAGKGNKPLTKKEETDKYWKNIYDTRKPTVGKNFGTTKTPFVGSKGTVVTSKKEEIKPRNNKQVNTNTQKSSTSKTTVSEFNSKAIMAKKKELADLRSNVPGFGPFRSSSNSKLVGDIDNINRQLYKISQKQSAFERNKTRGLGDAQALKEAKARELEFKNLTKNLKFK